MSAETASSEAASNATRHAVLSACGRFRYRLTRRWSSDAPALCFVMLNPSTADDTQDDQTVRKCIGFAERFGYGALEVVNLFAFRATDPRELRHAGFPVGPLNDGYIAEAAARARASAADVVCAWGAHARPLVRPREVLALLKTCGVRPMVLDRCSDGTPAHPLMLPYTCKLQPLDA